MGSSKPCPGCKKINSNRKSTDVCRECQEKLDLYGELKREFEKTTQDKITFKIGERSHWNRYFYVKNPGYENRNIGHELRDSIFNVCIAGSVHVSKNGLWGNAPHIMSDKSHHSGAVLRASSQEFFDSIQDLMEVVQRAVDLSFEAGQKDGQKLLVDIAEGQKSIQDYEDRFVR